MTDQFQKRTQAVERIAGAIVLLENAYKDFNDATTEIAREAQNSGNRRQAEGIVHAAGNLPSLVWTAIEKLLGAVKLPAGRDFVESARSTTERAKQALEAIQ